MKVLFDHNVPHKLRHLLPGHEIKTADEMSWAELDNGLLLAAEDAGFDVMLTADNNLSYQQNLTGRKLALVVLSTNRWKLVRDAAPAIARAVGAANPGSFQRVVIQTHPRNSA